MSASKPFQDAVDLAADVRRRILTMVHRASASHVGSCLSAVEIVSALYAPSSGWLRLDPAHPDRPDRDRFILSKGHAAALLYATLAMRGFFPEDWLGAYCGDGSRLGGHSTSHGVPGVELSTGSLGHGLSVGLGLAVGLRDLGSRVCVLLSDGELDEGSTWEAILFAPRLRADNLVAIVDYNKIQSLGRVEDVMPLEPLLEKWRSFGWSAMEVDGHSPAALAAALAAVPTAPGLPSVIVAHTIKGKGVSFMEDRLLWHYRSPNDEELARALAEVDAAVRVSVPGGSS